MRWALPLLALQAAASVQAASDATIVLHNRSGMEVDIIPHGATITRVIVPDRAGHRDDVVLGYATAAEYREKNRKNMFGATIGRYAGRIAGAQFVLDGKTVRLVRTTGRTHCMAAARPASIISNGSLPAARLATGPASPSQHRRASKACLGA